MWIIGTLALFTANLGRLYVVLYAGVFFGPGAAEIVHTISWFIVSVLILWIWFVMTKRIAGIKKFNELL
jgi:hypothetical protein